MKVFVIILVAYLSGAYGQLNQTFVENILKDVRLNMTHSGFDPLVIGGNGFNYSLPVTDLLQVRAEFGGAQVTGLSNLVLSEFRYDALLSQAIASVTLPLVAVTINQTDARFKLFDLDLTGQVSGSVEIVDIVVSGTVRINLSLRGIEVTNVTLATDFGNILSNLEVIVMQQDVSDRFNTFLNTTVLNSLNNDSDEIEDFIENYIMQALDTP